MEAINGNWLQTMAETQLNTATKIQELIDIVSQIQPVVNQNYINVTNNYISNTIVIPDNKQTCYGHNTLPAHSQHQVQACHQPQIDPCLKLIKRGIIRVGQDGTLYHT